MLSRLLLRNFQTHEKLDLELEDVTVLVGQTDVGKSAVVRALKWLVSNRPSGNDFIRYGEDECLVQALFEKHKVVRRKGKENTYKLDKEEFKAFGSGVPEAVTNVINVDEELNFQNQHDAAFWFCNTAGEVAKKLNSIVNLDSLDAAQSYMRVVVNEAKSEFNVISRQQEQDEQRLKTLNFVPEMLKEFRVCDTLNEEHETLVDSIADLSEMVDVANTKKKQLNRVCNVLDAFHVVEQSFTDYVALRERTAALQSKITEMRTAKKQADKKIPDLFKFDQASDRLRSYKNDATRIAALIDNMKTEAATLRLLQSDLERAYKELAVSEKEEARCPTCGQVIKH